MHVVFSVDQTINQNKYRNCTNMRSALFQIISVFFSINTSINRKSITSIISYLISTHFKMVNIHKDHFKDIKKLKFCVKLHIIWCRAFRTGST